MIDCAAIGSGNDPGLAAAMRQADCLAAQSGGATFARLFGLGGALGSALTTALTLYVAWLAIGLLTGRGTLRLSSVTPRMLGLGMILTFATSWLAYQTAVWNLLTGAPDQIASALLGTHGSATQQFANRLDKMFVAISDTAKAAATGAPAGGEGPFTPSNMLWVAALLMLFGSLGVLLVARIALTALLGLGPIFILFGLFRGTRGLLDGWIRAAVMFSVTQLLGVLIGGEALAVIAPIVQRIAVGGTAPQMHDAILLLLAAGVFITLMAISLKAAGTIVSSWRPTALSGDAPERAATATRAEGFRQPFPVLSMADSGGGAGPITSDQSRISGVVAAIGANRAGSTNTSTSIRAIGLTDVRQSDNPAIGLPYQTVVAHNRRSSDRLRDVKDRSQASASSSARTLFR